MKRTHQLIKLRVETADDLNRLKTQAGALSLDDLIMSMIELMHTYRMGLRDVGWLSDPSKQKR